MTISENKLYDYLKTRAIKWKMSLAKIFKSSPEILHRRGII
jgi:hypothetical protein